MSQSISVMDYFYSEGYDVSVTNEEDGSWQRYVIAMDGERLVRVDLADSDHIYHRAFPDVNLFWMSYRIDSDRPALDMSSAAALEAFLDDQGLEMEKEELPYASWQKEGYERLIGVELPDHYYVMPGEEETHYIYYNGITARENGLFHIICCAEGDSIKKYFLNDLTGEVTENPF